VGWEREPKTPRFRLGIGPTPPGFDGGMAEDVPRAGRARLVTHCCDGTYTETPLALVSWCHLRAALAKHLRWDVWQALDGEARNGRTSAWTAAN
jgi:hypothetical protein